MGRPSRKDKVVVPDYSEGLQLKIDDDDPRFNSALARGLAPALVAAVVGCWVVGAVDSVLDLPRVATWLLLLNAMALQLHLPGRAARQAQRLDTKA